MRFVTQTEIDRPGRHLTAPLADPAFYAGDPHPLFARLRADRVTDDLDEAVGHLQRHAVEHLPGLVDVIQARQVAFLLRVEAAPGLDGQRLVVGDFGNDSWTDLTFNCVGANPAVSNGSTMTAPFMPEVTCQGIIAPPGAQ